MAPLSITPGPVAPGRIMSAAEVAAEKFHGHRSARWVREHAPSECRLPGTREALYFASRIDKWLVDLEIGRAS
jgi:hypothetical protein